MVEDTRLYWARWGHKHTGLGNGLEPLGTGGCLGVPDGPQLIGEVAAEQGHLPSRPTIRDCHVYPVRRRLLLLATGALIQHLLQ